MVMVSITASQFKARCLALLDDVAGGGGELVITKHGEPVARLVPVEPVESLQGSVTFDVSDEEFIMPLSEAWEASE